MLTAAFISTSFSSGSVSVIDTATNTVVGSPIPVGTNPVGVAATPAGRFAYVANANSDTVSVISTATNTVVGSPIPVGSGPSGVALTPDGRFAYVGIIVHSDHYPPRDDVDEVANLGVLRQLAIRQPTGSRDVLGSARPEIGPCQESGCRAQLRSA